MAIQGGIHLLSDEEKAGARSRLSATDARINRCQ